MKIDITRKIISRFTKWWYIHTTSYEEREQDVRIKLAQRRIEQHNQVLKKQFRHMWGTLQ